MIDMKTLSAAGIATLLVACGTTPKEETKNLNRSIPAWVLNPIIEDGVASTECVNSSGNMTIDKAQAVATARAGIVKQINLKVQAMDKTYARKTEAGDKMVTSNVFESVSKQVAQQYLAGSRPERVEFVEIGGKVQLCAMVTLKPEVTDKIFKGIIEQSGQKVAAKDEAILYEEFKAHKAHQELEASQF